MRIITVIIGGLLLTLAIAGVVIGQDNAPAILGVRVEFALFAVTLLGVALLHQRTLEIALAGLTSLLLLKFLTDPDFHAGEHLLNEASVLGNLLGLLLGFALLSRHFEQSNIPEFLPRILPDDWRGGFLLLAIVFTLSSFLDNIAAAIIGGTIARHVYRGRLDIGFLAAIVAASNAGGAGSVVGDTTTTMMWIEGISALSVLTAYVAAVPAFLILALPAAIRQQSYQPIQREPGAGAAIEWRRVAVVALMLAGTISANVLLDFPALGLWLAIGFAACFIRTDFRVVLGALRSSLFLLTLVTAASLMPVAALPPASWQTTFGLGWISAVFDNIPLTKLALEQGGYDAGMLAFAVGFGGSMIWFGSSAGVALSNLFPEMRYTLRWLGRAWFVPLAYAVGFFTLLLLTGWNPTTPG